jgi:Leucine-rich repeat (LRR) protein
MALVQQDRIDAGVGFDWSKLPPNYSDLSGISHEIEELRFTRERASHRGIHQLQQLRRVWLFSVNQDFLDEIVQVPSIEMIYISGLTASDLRPLKQLRRLRQLILIDGTKVLDLDWVAELPPLQSLFLENFKRVSSIDALIEQQSLSALGFEGSMWTSAGIPTLSPLKLLSELRYLFLGNIRPKDCSLESLHGLKHLKLLQCAAAFPDEEFLRLKQALPKLRCAAFDLIQKYGSVREGIRAIVRESKL